MRPLNISHILRKDSNNDCLIAMTWAPEVKRKGGRPKITSSRMKDGLVDGEHGMRCEPQPEKGQRGDLVQRPYVPFGTKWTGNR